MNPELQAAFAATCYCVSADGEEFDLRIGQVHAGFDAFLARCGASEWVIITAFNPGALPASEAENTRSHAGLSSFLEATGNTVYHSRALADAGNWPPEPGFLVPGMDAVAGRVLGRAYGQAAIVHAHHGRAPQLLWC